jgi:uncharacterized membrane protein
MIDSAIDAVYRLTGMVDYFHPIHAPLTHMPIAGAIAVLIFAIVALLFRSRNLAVAARYSLILAFVFAFPTILTGYMDWQYFYGGAWLFEIKAKLVLAGVLLILLASAIFVGRKGAGESGKSILLYVLCFLTVSALGYFGGNLVFARRITGLPEHYKEGQRIFLARCGACHPHGGNIFNAKLPLRGAPELVDFSTFAKYLNDPILPDGSRGQMPAFPPSKLSEARDKLLYDYITQVLLKLRGP